MVFDEHEIEYWLENGRVRNDNIELKKEYSMLANLWN